MTSNKIMNLETGQKRRRHLEKKPAMCGFHQRLF